MRITLKADESTTYLNAVVAGGDASILHLDVGGRVSELALGVRARALVALELAAHLELQPARVLAVQQGVHVDHCHAGTGRGEGQGRGGGGIRRNKYGHDFDDF